MKTTHFNHSTNLHEQNFLAYSSDLTEQISDERSEKVIHPLKLSFFLKKPLLFVSAFLFGMFVLNAQTIPANIPLIGSEAPSFTAQSTQGKIKFPSDFGSNWKILFSHPKDFTPVCSSELIELSQQQEDYKNMGVSVLVISIDNVDQHKSWKDALDKITYRNKKPVKIEFPLVDDSDYQISHKYGMVHPMASKAENVRAVFIIDPLNKVRAINFYPNEVGRNMDEIKRTVVALQAIGNSKGDVAPANWQPGEELMVPYLTEDENKNIGKPGAEIDQVVWFMNFRKQKK